MTNMGFSSNWQPWGQELLFFDYTQDNPVNFDDAAVFMTGERKDRKVDWFTPAASHVDKGE